MSKYRLNRAVALGFGGINFVVAGVAAFLAFVLTPVDGWLRYVGIVAAVVGGLAFLFAVRWTFLPPVFARLSASRLTIGTRRASDRIDTQWIAVEGVAVEGEGRLRSMRVDFTDGHSMKFALFMVEPRGTELLREVHERLNTAHGYKRIT